MAGPRAEAFRRDAEGRLARPAAADGRGGGAGGRGAAPDRGGGGDAAGGAEPLVDRRPADGQGAHHQLQQLLRVRDGQGGSRAQRRAADDRALDRGGRRALRPPRQLCPRRPRQAGAARGAHLPAALRRGLVDGDPLDRLSARRRDRRGRARQPSAKFVAFETLVRPEEMPGQSGLFQVLDWPYVEGLRLDEAMHPLTILATGLYGEELPNQNGAPIRLVVPWKYGFKSIKSIVRISFVADEPPTTWNLQAPNEYGFYSNVNPAVEPPALEPGDRAGGRRGAVRGAAADRAVQRLCRGGGRALCRHGPREVLLNARRGPDQRLAAAGAGLAALLRGAGAGGARLLARLRQPARRRPGEGARAPARAGRAAAAGRGAQP